MTGWRRPLAAAAALTVSGVLHAAGLVLGMPGGEAVAIEGGGAPEPAALGADFADFAAGAIPVLPASAAVPAAVPAVRAAAPSAAPPVAPPAASAALAEPVPAASVRAEAAAIRPPPEAAVPATTTAAEAQAADRATANPQASAAPAARAAAVPVSAADPAPAEGPSPRQAPRPRPERLAALAEEAPAAAPTNADRPAATAPQRSGNGDRNARRGSATGTEAGRTAASGAPAAAADAAGTAAAANYPGEVLRRITRLRKPAAPAPGRVVVSFTIAASGGLAAVRVVRSSGSAALDRLALDHIRRAAPFPPPPAGALTSFSFEFVGRP